MLIYLTTYKNIYILFGARCVAILIIKTYSIFLNTMNRNLKSSLPLKSLRWVFKTREKGGGADGGNLNYSTATHASWKILFSSRSRMRDLMIWKSSTRILAHSSWMGRNHSSYEAVCENLVLRDLIGSRFQIDSCKILLLPVIIYRPPFIKYNDL